MKLIIPYVQHVFDFENGKCNTLVVENQKMLYSLLEGIYNQINGFETGINLFENQEKLRFDKRCELIDSFIPFDINRKSLLNKLNVKIEEIAKESFFSATTELIGEINNLYFEIVKQLDSDVEWKELDFSALVKLGCFSFSLDGTICERLLSYFKIVTELEESKLFVLINFRSFVCDIEFESFMDTVLRKGYNVLCIENHEYIKIANEERVIIDPSFCEI